MKQKNTSNNMCCKKCYGLWGCKNISCLCHWKKVTQPSPPSDLKPFIHGEEGTHAVCKVRLKAFGAKAPCCICFPHDGCDLTSPPSEWERFTVPSHHVWSVKEDKETGGYIVVVDIKKPVEMALATARKDERSKMAKEAIKTGHLESHMTVPLKMLIEKQLATARREGAREEQEKIKLIKQECTINGMIDVDYFIEEVLKYLTEQEKT